LLDEENAMTTVLGWVGALLALAAYAQTRAMRFRVIALLSSVALLTFAVILGIWSNVALESALLVVNVRRLVQLRPTIPRRLTSAAPIRGRRRQTHVALDPARRLTAS
jgi:hypothetical protein